ncbi:MAG: hypothetical protein R3C69_00060 [Geminicoccaceae bacterium]
MTRFQAAAEVDAGHGLEDRHRLDRVSLQAAMHARRQHREQAGLLHGIIDRPGKPALLFRRCGMALDDGADTLDSGKKLFDHRSSTAAGPLALGSHEFAPVHRN